MLDSTVLLFYAELQSTGDERVLLRVVKIQSVVGKVQYLAFTHRTRLWRRAPVLALSAKEGSAPLGVTSRRHLEMVLEEMGPEFGRGSRNAGKRKAFAHSVAQFFKLQEERFKFRVYTLSERAECDDGVWQRRSRVLAAIAWDEERTVATESTPGSKQAAMLATLCHPTPIAL